MTYSAEIIVKRMQDRIDRMRPGSPAVLEAFTKIGTLLQAQIKINIRSKGIVDSGTLLNSIQYEFFKEGNKEGIRIGSFGVKYAAINEFGGVFTDQMRKAMFASLRDRGRQKTGVSKRVITNNQWKARPYIRPAIKKHTNQIIDTLRAAYFGSK